MPSTPYLIFDAGGTLLFPDQTFIIPLAQTHGITLSPEQLYTAFYHVIHDLDRHIRHEGYDANPWPDGFAYALLAMIGLNGAAAETMAEACQVQHRAKSLWTFTFAWVTETLSRLAGQGYRMSVISNADGRVKDQLRAVSLAGHFDEIFDSTLVGVEKPDPAIFEIALQTLNLEPAGVLYIGDTVMFDVVGANRAGVGCVHLDPLGLYTTWPGMHIPDIRHLPDWLEQYAINPAAFDLFPTR
jgi:putative hydrolase of the HAD superfamily